ncbi:transcriptional regulator domain-containing protein [Rhizorhabdus phycosphaerae]|uniref:transcriptional regulator domain-containing protein n=1 Tax=Rhizorhabdus phycosphaerae TaxID=2711156 RepID=UPI003CD0D3B4
MVAGGIEEITMPGYHRLRLPADYQVLTALDARGFAWEWLRRNSEFRDLYCSAAAQARRARTTGEAIARRSARTLITIAQHPLARRWSQWGLTFRARSRHRRSRGAGGRLESRA